ncbi:MAG: SMC-Scp complex subunit ScpB, partial [Nitrospira sp.]|nr:SMC-Scp complex subunit ScpB [Nitrospira sp.]
GVETSGVLRTLLDQKLVRIVGRQDVPGRPILYGTSKQFLQRFGLRDLRDLPPLKEFKELGDPEQASLDFLVDSTDSSDGPQVNEMSA